MFSFIRQCFREWARSGTRAGARVRPVRRLECESLEDRLLLSLTGAQIFANSLPVADHAVTASASDGHSVAVWQAPSGRSTFTDLHAQLFSASGAKVGSEFLVAGNLQDQYKPTVAMNASGQFVVAWTLQFSTTDTDIHASLFNANGTVRAGDFGVATSPKQESDASAGIATDGSFDISYTLQFSSSDQDVHAAMFSSAAQELRDITVANSSQMENHSQLTEAGNGEFKVAYQVNGLSTAKFYSSSGVQLVSATSLPSTPPPTSTPTTSTPTNSLSAAQAFLRTLPSADHPVLASYPGGRSVVVWTSASSASAVSVLAQEFGPTGQKVGGVQTVASGAGVRFSPTVAVNASGGFVVAWTVATSSTNRDLHATLFRADLSRVRSDFAVAATASAEYSPTAGIDASGGFVVSYTRQASGSNTDVLAAQFNAAGGLVRTVSVATTLKTETNTGIAVAADGNFAVSYTSAGTPLVARFAAPSQPTGGTTQTTTPPPSSSTPTSSLAAAQAFLRTLPSADHPVLASYPGGRSVVVWTSASSASAVSVLAQEFGPTGQKVGGVQTVASGTGVRFSPTVAVNASGGFVVAWTVATSSTNRDIHATLFRADLSRVRSDFAVAATASAEYSPTAGIDASGGFVVSYTRQASGSNTDVLAAQFNAAGGLVRTVSVATTLKTETNTGIAVAADGSFAVSYTSAGTPLVARFAAPSQPTGGTTQTTTPPPSSSTPTNSLLAAQAFLRTLPSADHPVLASYPGGRSVVVWTSASSASAVSVLTQVFGPTGQKIGGVQTVASGTGVRFSPTVAVNASGGFVVAWTVASSSGVRNINATLFRADLSRIRSNFVVVATPVADFSPSAGIDAAGNIVISFTHQVVGGNTDVLANQFNSAGGFVRTVSVATTLKAEVNTGIAVAPNGTFAVSYTSAGTPLVAHFTATGQPVAGTTQITTPPPSSTPQPLSGTVIGSYSAVSAGTGQGTRFNITSSGYLVGLGQTTATGSLTSTGSLASSSATGVLTLRDASGTVTLSVVAPPQGPHAPLPTEFHYSVTSGTGAFSSLHSSGELIVHLTPSRQSISLEIDPA